jgi:Leucine-rich repeat (LRR) protein
MKSLIVLSVVLIQLVQIIQGVTFDEYDRAIECGFQGSQGVLFMVKGVASAEKCQLLCRDHQSSCTHYAYKQNGNLADRECHLKKGIVSKLDAKNSTETSCGIVQKASKNLLFPTESVKATLHNVGGIQGTVEFVTREVDFGKYSDATNVNPKFLGLVLGVEAGNVQIKWDIYPEILKNDSYYYELYLGINSALNFPTKGYECTEPEKKVKLVEISKTRTQGIRTFDISLLKQLSTGLHGKKGISGTTIFIKKVANGEWNKGEIIACGITLRKFDETNDLAENFFKSTKCSGGLEMNEAGLSAFVDGILDYDATELDLSNKRIACIEKETFRKFKKLHTLSLNHNRLVEINEGLFADNIALTTLYLHQNSIVSIPENLLENNIALKILYLGENSIVSIPENLLKNNKNLKKLYLLGNSIVSIPENLLKNNIALTTLLLHENSIVSIPENLLERNIALVSISLSKNSIVSIPENLLKNNDALSRLYLHDNSIVSIPENLLKNNKNLKKLYLLGNSIVSIPENLFEENTALEELKIQNNHIKYQDQLLNGNNIEAFKSYIGLNSNNEIFQWNGQTEKI